MVTINMEKEKTKLLKNKYKLERKIAQGGMSSIYLCTNIELGNTWIAKHINKRYSGFIYEEEILKRLNHINLPRIIDICKDDSGVYIIESYIEGVSLQKMLEDVDKLRLDKVIEYTLQLCDVLIYLHNMQPMAIIHRDLKPSNIIITEYDKLVLIDFGISAEQGGIGEGLKAGTNSYAAPEQLVNADSVNTTIDIYSLGILLYQMTTGQMPGMSDISDERSIIYDRLIEISKKCSRFHTEERYQKVEHIKNDLMYLANKYILIKENNKIKRRVILSLVCLLSIINYICLILGLIYY
jgi:serine/threonine protein kinase